MKARTKQKREGTQARKARKVSEHVKLLDR